MKKSLVMLMLVLGTMALLTACKKDEKTAKETATENLTSGKWFYQSFKNSTSSTPRTCFTAADYWEFKADGTFTETRDFGNGTYTVSEDGKTLTLQLSNESSAPASVVSVTSLNTNNFSFKLNYRGTGSEYEFTTSKTAQTCVR